MHFIYIAKEVGEVNKIVSASLTRKGKGNPTRGKYSSYTAEERTQIGRYASENGPTLGQLATFCRF